MAKTGRHSNFVTWKKYLATPDAKNDKNSQSRSAFIEDKFLLKSMKHYFVLFSVLTICTIRAQDLFD